MPGPPPAKAKAGNRKKVNGKKPVPNNVKAKRQLEKQKIETLDKEAMDFVPPPGLKAFADLPISQQTMRGLKKAFFVTMTDIQRASLPVSLQGRDVLGAARTGSGKTLAFLVPVLEILHRRKWGPMDGLGALIISPTRELAVQIFEVLRSIGGYHSFSAGLVIGGKNLKDERDRLARMNILVATPGRLLQHMDETVGFEADNLQLLILDEADRILDMGFQRTLTALLAHLPKSRQTLLFSATQTESISDLARLSLKDPVPIGVSSDPTLGAATQIPSSSSSSDPSTKSKPTPSAHLPANLAQHFAVVELDKKLDVLWSFIKAHTQAKTLVFLSSCKQVRFAYAAFCKMQPGVPLLHLHGKQRQPARLATYAAFSRTRHAVLVATDIAARGLDFPAVDWVVQVDAPEDAETYIHRVGRTARYESKGKGLLLLCPNEEQGMLAALRKKGVEVERIRIRPSKTQSVKNMLQKFAFQEPEMKYLGQKAFMSYLRSVHLRKDKSIFDVAALPVERFAESLGLPGTPRIKFLNKARQSGPAHEDGAKMARVEQATRMQQQQQEGEEEEDESENESENESESESDDGGAGSSESGSASGSGSGSEEEEEEDSESEAKGGSKEESEKPPQTTAVDKSKPVVKTKYDRMFGRKNQNILSAHYAKLIEHSDDSDEDFITLKRADHDLDDPSTNDPSNPNPNSNSNTNTQIGALSAADVADNLSKRKLKMGRAKRVIATGGLSTKTIFDAAGNPHALYELEDVEQLYVAQGGLAGVQAEGQRFAEAGRGEMRVADVRDKEEARERRKEKKRKRKDRERERAGLGGEGGGGGGGGGAYVSSMEEDDDGDGDGDGDKGYVSPDLDLPTTDDEDVSAYATFEEMQEARALREKGAAVEKKGKAVVGGGRAQADEPVRKKAKLGHGYGHEENTLEDDEALALELLRRRRG